MSSIPLPLALPLDSNARSVVMLPLDSCRYHLLAPAGTVASAIAVPVGTKSVRVVALTQDVWMRHSTEKPSNTLTSVAIPSTAVNDGSAPCLVPAGGADSFLLPAGCTFLVFYSTGNVLLEWFA